MFISLGSRFWCAISLIGFLTLVAGCDKAETVAHYTVLKPPPIDPLPASANPHGADPHAGLGIDAPPSGEPKDRTLAAIVPVGEQGWFFKLTGPKDAVAAKADEFTNFLKTVRFAEGKPQWTLPAEWQERPGNDIRFATLVIPGGEKPLEVSVTVLPKSGDDAAYALVNINRWRGQLRLPPIAQDQLPAESTTIELAGAKATLVNLLGTAAPGGMGGGPFSGGGSK